MPILVPQSLTLDEYLGRGKQEDEADLPQDAAASSAPELQFDAAAMAQLEGIGFPTVRCQKALLATGNSDAETAMNWLFAHMEDPGDFLGAVDLPSFSDGSELTGTNAPAMSLCSLSW